MQLQLRMSKTQQQLHDSVNEHGPNTAEDLRKHNIKQYNQSLQV